MFLKYIGTENRSHNFFFAFLAWYVFQIWNLRLAFVLCSINMISGINSIDSSDSLTLTCGFRRKSGVDQWDKSIKHLLIYWIFSLKLSIVFIYGKNSADLKILNFNICMSFSVGLLKILNKIFAVCHIILFSIILKSTKRRYKK